MSGIYEVIKTVPARCSAYLDKARLRREFLSRSDRFLDDVGLSRDLLEQGVGAWPWKSSEQNCSTRATARPAKSLWDFFARPDFAAMSLSARRPGRSF
ncbi:MAG: hypothetical protein KF909_02765 [Rhodocyclaceae bacterium]|nr:hypothetical protein [Rhodocyclaceae bacterium]MCB9963311.1 hypothetical protein [Hyphomonas sp.]MCP5233624.1 hypothetical protein [Zoogloeaceae bacterium]MCB1910668.1 hypothetical protein [Rhodocyclaceae bacterium]MCP5239408.1 hypothetical protein [Zoogloeaceae bacterium]